MTKSDGYSTVVRIMGQGQFKVSEDTVKKINEVDDAIVQILQNESKTDDQEFRTKITKIVQTITSEGQKLDDKELVESDIIVPDTDTSIDEAKKVFQGEGIIPEL
jgi:PspA-Associated protein